MQTMVKATFTIIDDDSKAKRTEVIEMVYPMDENRNFLKALIDYLEDDENEETEITLDDEQVEIEEVEEPTLYAVKINGVEEMVTLDELQSSFSRQKDYTRKTQDLAAQKKKLQNMRAEISQKDEVYSELLPKMQSALENSLGQEPNWQELYDNDPISYVREKDVWEEKKKQLEAVQAEVEDAEFRLTELEKSLAIADDQMKTIMGEHEVIGELFSQIGEIAPAGERRTYGGYK